MVETSFSLEELESAVHEDKWVYSPEADAYSLQHVSYCVTPAKPELQNMNIYIPKEYVRDGRLFRDGICGKYTALSAPVVFQSAVSGYSESPARVLIPGQGGPDTDMALDLLSSGYIYVSAGVRGKQTLDDSGRHIGKSPAMVADLKAAIRFYRHCSAFLPGDTDKIIIVGVSAGGNLALLIGCTGDSADYEAELNKQGAIMDESDAIFASAAYCPITDLDHANGAYEWMFSGVGKIKKMRFPMLERGKPAGAPAEARSDAVPVYEELDPFSLCLSEKLEELYVEYVNSLLLRDPESGEPLTLDNPKHSGTLYGYIVKKLEDAATGYIKGLGVNKGYPNCTPEEFIKGEYSTEKRFNNKPRLIPGDDVSSWMSWDGERAVISSLADMEEEYLPRAKIVAAFDNFALCESENEVFGGEGTSAEHYSTMVYEAMKNACEAFPEETASYLGEYERACTDSFIESQCRMLNPLLYISDTGALKSKHFRIRVGSKDNHTSFTVSAAVALKLMEKGIDTDYGFTWGASHGFCEHEGALLEWIDGICG